MCTTAQNIIRLALKTLTYRSAIYVADLETRTPLPGRLVSVVHLQTAGSETDDADKGYKRVAVVEDFLDIIYKVHVGTDGRGGKHAGQKRTYKAVSTI